MSMQLNRFLSIAMSLVLTLCSAELLGIEITSKFYPSGQIPQELYLPDQGHLTLFEIQGWPKDSTISFIETRPFLNITTEKNKAPPGDKSKYYWTVYSIGYYPGEPVSFTFEDKRKKISKKVTVVPNRLYAESPFDHAVIEAQILQMSLPFTYKIEFKGFAENEKLLLESSSYDEEIRHEFPNPGVITFMPGVVEKLGGIAQFCIQRPSGEKLKLELPWGVEMIKYIIYLENGQAKSVLDNPQYMKNNPEIDLYFKTQLAPKS